MLKFEIFTLIGFENYGNKLQNYALSEILKKFFGICETYLPQSRINCEAHKAFNALLKRKFIYYIKRTSIFVKFSVKNIPSKIYNRKKEKPTIDYIICGSDQIWNPFVVKEESFGTFAPPEKRISFSASFGVSEIPESKKEFYKKHLNEMKAISVREQAGVEIVKELTGRDATLLVDPTMMLSKEEWQKVSKKPKFSVPEKYIFTYFLGNVTDEMREFIDKVAKENDMQIINLEAKEPNNYWYRSGPSEFVWLIEHASIVLTDSFHGSVFSIINEAPFVVFDRVENIECMNSRIDTLLSTLKLEDRRFDKIDMNKLFEKEYSHVPEILEREKKKAIEFLKNAMEI